MDISGLIQKVIEYKTKHQSTPVRGTVVAGYVGMEVLHLILLDGHTGELTHQKFEDFTFVKLMK